MGGPPLEIHGAALDDGAPLVVDHGAAQDDPYAIFVADDSPGDPPHSDARTSRFRVLHLFSGPCGRPDGLAAYLQAVGIEVTDCDIINLDSDDQDIADDAVWGRIKARMQSGDVDFVFAGPPCRSFSASRGSGPGPPVLRDELHLYGFPKSGASSRGLLPHHFEQIRLDNLLAERSAEACGIMESLGNGYAVEQPIPWRGAVSMFQFTCFLNLVGSGAKVVRFDQCMFGAPTRKPTQIIYGNSDFSSLEAWCDHAGVEQWDDHGRSYLAPHPSIVGKKDKSGTFLTSSLAAYPRELCCKLATLIMSSVASRPSSSS
jgi:hypothetical protein